ncbi:hypothetical protein M378DRAFT_173260 [Amanita muscaria Koide BX008]|uniref:Uncharacterized protein n=1 Tax=Amanita muscaria (strain Koide BX008) TaxID=946122 RepID=A0A0C2WGS7_AMAMK|nr:hypothetical protein M378DRAFT_173260 [Amanita muscaria Koide BX008]
MAQTKKNDGRGESTSTTTVRKICRLHLHSNPICKSAVQIARIPLIPALSAQLASQAEDRFQTCVQKTARRFSVAPSP